METVTGMPKAELDVMRIMSGVEHITYGSSGSRVMYEDKKLKHVAVATLTGGVASRAVSDNLNLDPGVNYAVVSRILSLRL
jgi:hypothetical protein